MEATDRVDVPSAEGIRSVLRDWLVSAGIAWERLTLPSECDRYEGCASLSGQLRLVCSAAFTRFGVEKESCMRLLCGHVVAEDEVGRNSDDAVLSLEDGIKDSEEPASDVKPTSKPA